MERKTSAVGAVILIVGLLVGGFVGGTIARPRPPTTHQNIINQIHITDLNYETYLVAECVHSGSSPQLTVTPGKKYDHTAWIWFTLEFGQTTGKDANAAMELWGPLDEGEYTAMISKLAGNNLRISWSTTTIGDLTTEDEAIGFTINADGTITIN
jgi:hypothetical protein